MLLWLTDYLSDFVRAFSVFQYLTLRSMVSAMTALLLSLIIGPSIVALDVKSPSVASTLYFFRLPSFMSICKTEDSRPPNLAGKPPFVSLTDLIASALKTENKPPI